jgi:hypothetical protein
MGSFIDIRKEFLKLFPGAGIIQVLPEKIFYSFFH